MIPYRLEDRTKEQLLDLIKDLKGIYKSINQAELTAAHAEIAGLRENLKEAVVLMIATRIDEYNPDSFTTQPWEATLATPSPAVEALVKLVEAVGEEVKSHQTPYMDCDCPMCQAYQHYKEVTEK